ncbi:RNA-directed DNA polymerase, eukaryota, reverse transcriptase zinc-binding domain protein [Tanacetum coccineum]
MDFNIVAWNIRGLGKISKQNAVKELLIDEKLSICAILETRLKGPKVKRIGDKVFGRWIWVDNAQWCSRGCRIMVGWDSNKVHCMVIHASDQAMFCLIENLSTKERILCSFIHAEMEGRLRKKLWIDLNNYKSICNNNPWIIIGDMNVSLNLEDHSEGMSYRSQDMEDFQDCVNNLKIDDVASTSLHFTWTKSLLNPNYSILKKIDRVMGNEEFFDIHKRAHVVFLPYGISDHSPAVLTCSKNMKAQTRAFRNLNEKVKKLKKALDDIQNSIDKDPYNDSLRKIGVDTLGEYSIALEDEEKLMFQRAKVQWMNEGDRNSAFFHKVIKGRISKNRVAEIWGTDNIRYVDDECLDLDSKIFKNKIDLDVAGEMIREVSKDEIKEAMFSIDDNKAPGPDELLKGYNCTKGPKRCSMKIDIQKAYDTVKWSFLEKALRMFGVHSKMIGWIMTCVSTPSYSICINGERHGYFKGGRGLRQGDPLSPYLFTIVMEVFNLILKQRISEEKNFKYHLGCKKLLITHLCFADDLLVLCHGDTTSVKVIKQALEDFSKISGLYPNLGKSTIFCGSIDDVTIARILNILPFKRGKLPVRYLGVPLVAKQLGVNDCKSLVDKVKSRVHDWKNKSLSYAGRAQLIASVLTSIQVFWASVFKLPKTVIKDIERIFKGFLWNQGELQKGKAKVSWMDVSNKKDTLWVRWIHMIKLKGRSISEVEKQCNNTSLWKSLMDLRNEVRIHMQYKIGNGNTISLWHDRWSLLPALDNIISRRKIYAAGFNNDTALADCIDNEGWKWPAQWFIDHPMLNQYPVPSLEENMEDKLMWCSNDGSLKNFSTSQVWNDTRRLNNKMEWWKVIWFPQNIPRKAFVLWMASKEKLVTQDKLSKWYPNKSWKCPLCLKVEDSHKHLFFDCDYSNTLWIEVQKMMNERDLNNLNECMHKLSCLPCKNSIWSIVRRLCIADAVYHIWEERNSRIFNQISMSSSNTTKSIIKSVRSRLLTLKVKHTTAVVEVESKWGINLKKCAVNKGLALCSGNRLGNVAKWDVSLSDSYPRVVPKNGISALGVLGLDLSVNRNETRIGVSFAPVVGLSEMLISGIILEIS